VVVDEGLREVMLEVRETLQGAIALVSGREIAALDALFAPQRWPAAGLHGLERRDATGCLHLRAIEGRRLDPAREALRDVASRTPGALLEDKGHALALHYRNAPDHEAGLRRAMQGVAAGLAPEFTVLEGKCVLELKPSAATKADAVREFLCEPPFVGRRPIYVGDDVTDLDGFAAVEQAGGLSVAVGDRVRAQRHVASPREVRSLLGDLARGRGPAA
jgi:trehalose 6-phosphate phosphatase